MTRRIEIQGKTERRCAYLRMVAELSQLDPHELSAILGLRSRDIPEYCRRAVESGL